MGGDGGIGRSGRSALIATRGREGRIALIATRGREGGSALAR